MKIPPVFRSVGPALVTAAVVLGPGSVVTSSMVGATFGFKMVWLLVLAIVLMIAMTALSARVGIQLGHSMCDEVARRAGRPLAVLVGLSVFAIAAGFQFGNNIGIYMALEPFVGGDPWLGLSRTAYVVIALNLVMVVFLFALKHLYSHLETLMKIMVGLMLVAFAVNLLWVVYVRQTDTFVEAAEEVVSDASRPALTDNLLPRREVDAKGNVSIVDPWRPLVSLLATTFSVAGAFFQAYLVQQKGWTARDAKSGLVDAVVGISALGLVSLIIMLTSALTLEGRTISSAADIANQLEPLFGRSAMVLFCTGLFAAAFSSLLVNAAIGGSLLADGLGLGGYLDNTAAKVATTLALAVGLVVALLMRESDNFSPVGLVLLAQGVTVIAWPLLAGVLLWLAVKPGLPPALALPGWLWALCWTGLAVALVVAPRTAYLVYLRLTG